MFSTSSILKKLTLGGVVFVMLFGTFVAPSNVYAQTAALRAIGADANTNTGGSEASCGVGIWGTASLMGCVSQLFYFIMSLFGWFMGAAAVLFSASVYWTIINLSALVNGLTAISSAWGILRDLANIALLFAFIAIGVMTILDSHEYGAKRLLPKLLIAAVMLNFSLFITKSIIDVGNVFAIQFYKPLNGGSVGPPSLDPSTEPISSAFMDATGLSKIYETIGTGEQLDISAEKIMFVSFMGMILFIVGAFVFLSLAIMFIARVVTLIFLMVVSPIGFIAGVIPGLESQGKAWWTSLINNALLGPATMLCLLISVNIITRGISETFGVNDASWHDWISTENVGAYGGAGLAGWANLMLVFVISSGFMMASLIVAKRFSATGAGFAMNFSKKAVGLPFALTRTAGGIAGRNTIGRGAGFLSKKYDVIVGRNKGLGKALRFTGLDEGIKKGLDSTANAKYGSSRSYGEQDKAIKERGESAEHAASAAKTQKDLTDSIEARTKAQAQNNPGAIAAADAKIAQILQGMSLHDIEEAKYLMGTEEGIKALAQNLSPEKFEKLMDSKNISETAKHQLGHTRFENLKSDNSDGKAAKLSQKDIELLAKYDTTKFGKIMEATQANGRSIFSDETLKALGKSNALNTQQQELANNNTIVKKVSGHIGAGRSTEAQLMLAAMSSEQKSELSAEDLASADVVDSLDQRDLAAMAAKKKLSAREIERIRDAVLALPGNHRNRQGITDHLANNQNAAEYWGI